jgi:hypothetical protein
MNREQNREALVVELARRAAESAIALGQPRITIDEMGDGSGRYYAAIGWDSNYHLYTPAPVSAPSWARARFPDWTHS